MEHTKNIAALLGMSHDDMAQVLGITRSQWSMFEAGQRPLKIEALQTLTLLLSSLQSQEKQTGETTTAEELRLVLQRLQSLQDKNQMEIKKTRALLSPLQKKTGAGVQLLRLARVLDQDMDNKTAIRGREIILKKAVKVADRQVSIAADLAQYQHQLEILEMEARILSKKIKRTEKTLRDLQRELARQHRLAQ